MPRKSKTRNLLVVTYFSSTHVLIPHHLTHLAEYGPATQDNISFILKVQICLQLGIRPKFRNKWSRPELALMRLIKVDLRLSVLKLLQATWLVSLYDPLTGSMGKRHIAKGWSIAEISELVQGKTTLSPEGPMENIQAIII